MTDEDYRLALCSHFAHYIKKLMDLLRCQNSCRLIQHQNIRASIKHLQYFNCLLLTHRHFGYKPVRHDFHVEARGKFLHPGQSLAAP